MFSVLNTVIDMQKKQAEYMVDVLPEGVLKTVTKNMVKVNADIAYKTVELADGYVDGLKKVFAK
jgi:hypothetical protein